MRKTLSKFGNSYALVIDKPIRELLGIRPDTPLELWSDGRRLVIEPRPDAMPPPVERAAAPVASESPYSILCKLVHRHGMSTEAFDRLIHKPMRMFAYLGGLEFDMGCDTPEELASIRRFEECLRVLEGGGTWEEALAQAAQLVPADPVRDEHRGQA